LHTVEKCPKITDKCHTLFVCLDNMNTEQKLNKEINTLFKASTAAKKTNAVKSKLTYNEFLSNKMLMISAIKRGIPYSLFDLIKGVTPFTESEWSELLNISTKSLHRYKKETKRFKPIHSEKIIEMAEVTELGEKVFGDKEKFKLWLNAESLALGKVKPIELLQHSYGKDLVIRELIHIEHGIFA
jgi:putative toxin-antitoxin system antitoxin component (TIGR02293 family)